MTQTAETQAWTPSQQIAPAITITPAAAKQIQRALAKRYAELFAVYLKHRDAITRVTFWGVTDGDSWLNGWPVRGRTSYPLLFDRAGKPKPAFDAVIRATEKPAFVP